MRTISRNLGSVWRSGMACAALALLLAMGGCPQNELISPTASPGAGTTEGGTKVTIRGLDFAGNTGVLFGERSATSVNVVNSALIEATTPALPAGMVDITLVNGDGSVTTIVDAFEFVAPDEPARPAPEEPQPDPQPAPMPAPEPDDPGLPDLEITSVKPTSGPVDGGTQLTIEGVGFVTDMTAFLGDSTVVTVNFVSPSVITLTTPANVGGIASLRLVAADSREVTVVDAFTYELDEADPGTDTDGDGLTDLQETTGRLIQIDDLGFGPGASGALLTNRKVTSDPTVADTDGDGLDDRGELLVQSDPRSVDTDSDGLTDEEEWRRWKTSPVSVDTDGDARDGQPDNAPNANLFDGAELFTLDELKRSVAHPASRNTTRVLRARATSPSLADTDGDGKSDSEEFDDSIRSSLVADLPLADINFVGEVDIRLFVTYEEGEGTEEEYGERFSTTETNTSSKSTSESTSVETAASKGFIGEILGAEGGIKAGLKGFALEKGLELGQKALCGALDTGGETSPRFNLDDPENIGENINDFEDGLTATVDAIGVCDQGSPKTTTTNTTTLTEESSLSAQEEHSKYLRESRTRTESTARGEIRAAIRIQNDGNFAYQLGGLFVTAMHWQSSPTPAAAIGDGAFRTIATLRPSVENFATVLAPGESTSEIEMVAENVNPQVIKQLLARPTAIFYSPASLELSDQDGVNLDFVTEQVFARTATILIDYGSGVEEQYEVATNVDRDSDGALVGISLGKVLGDTLGIPFETSEVEGAQVLTAVRDVANVTPNNLGDPSAGVARDPLSMWLIYYQEDNLPGDEVDFEDVIIRNGDVIRMFYTRDIDGDGLFEREEGTFGTTDEIADADGDGLTDYQETKIGWTVSIDYQGNDAPDTSYQVFPSPIQVDQDGDSLSDADERLLGTDPTNPDTDDDTLLDHVDPRPLIPSRRLYVNQNVASGDGSGDSWENAISSLEAALAFAATNNDPNAPGFDPRESVAEIWVAAGLYTAPPEGFRLVNGVNIYGGFAGNERRRAGRTADPQFNGTVLSGEPLNENDPYVANIVVAENISINSTIDGFAIQRGGTRLPDGGFDFGLADGAGAGLLVENSALTLVNLWFRENYAPVGGALAVNVDGLPNGAAPRPMTIRNCRFVSNRSRNRGGAAYVRDADLTITDSLFAQNRAGDIDRENLERDMGGGALDARDATVLLQGSRFLANSAENRQVPGGTPTGTLRGGAVLISGDSTSVVRNCSFHENQIDAGQGSAIDFANLAGGGLALVAGQHSISNSAFAGNIGGLRGGGLFLGSRTDLTNCTIAFNNVVDLTGGNPEHIGIAVDTEEQILFNNCILAQNGSDVYFDQIRPLSGTSLYTLESCLVQGLDNYDDFVGFNNIDGSPQFVSPLDLRLMATSPCIDAGNRFVDTDSTVAGFQGLPLTDLAANARVLDGDGDGEAEVDMGAYEYQGEQ